MKRKLLLITMALAISIGAWAQTGTLVKMKTTATSKIEVFVFYDGDGTIKDADGVELSRDRGTLLRPDGSGNIELTAIGAVTLTHLYCSGNELTSLDVSGCTALTVLWCEENKLTNLDVSNCTELTVLWCHNNQLESLDVSKCTELTRLGCENNQLESLDVSTCSELTTLSCSDNNLTTLDVSGITKLIELECDDNNLTSLDVSANTGLTRLSCYNNQLESLDVSKCTELTTLWCRSNQLTTLNISGCTALINFGANLQKITTTSKLNPVKYTNAEGTPESITIDGMPYAFGDPLLAGGDFTTKAPVGSDPFSGTITVAAPSGTLVTMKTTSTSPIDVSVFYNGDGTIKDASGVTLTSGSAIATALTPDANGNIELKADGTVILTYLKCSGGQLTNLDIMKCAALTNLNCSNNNLTTLDVSENTALTSLSCFNNDLTTLDVSANTGLTVLDCKNNNLTALDMPANMALTALTCNNNQLASLDVSGCAVLTNLNCSDNLLTTLDVSSNTKLNYLSCPNNNLTALDVSATIALTYLYCYNNNLTTLNISGSTALDSFNANNQTITATGNLNPITYTNADGNVEPIVINGTEYLYGDLLPPGGGTFTTTAPVGSNPFSGTITLDDTPPAIEIATMQTAIAEGNTIRLWVAWEGEGSITANGEVLPNGTDTDVLVPANQIITLAATGSTQLTYLDCDANQLTELNLSNCPDLTELSCYDNQLTALDLSGCPDLTYLYCHANQLTELNLSGCANLVELECSDNQLTELDLSNCLDLMLLYCNNNQLNELNLSHCTELTMLFCWDNQLTTLDIQGCTQLTNLRAEDQIITLPEADALNGNLSIANPLKYNGSSVTSITGATLSGDNVTWSGLSGATGNAEFTFSADDPNFSGKVIVPWTNIITNVSVTGVSLDKTTLSMDIGEEEQLTATVNPADATNKAVGWESSDTDVATVSSTGEVKAIAPGTATITVTTDDGVFTATCEVIVFEPDLPVVGVSLNKATLNMDIDDEERLTATVNPADATNKAVSWTSSNTAVATVDSNGKVKGIAPGVATITVTTDEGDFTATCEVTVNPTTGIEPLEAFVPHIYADQGHIVVRLPETANVQIVTLTGATIYSSQPSEGTHQIAVSKGVYIVKAGSAVRKLRVES